MASSLQPAAPEPKISVQSTSSEFRGKLNLKPMIDAISSYSNGQSIKTTSFPTCCGSGSFIIYPQGRTNNVSENMCSVLLKLKIHKKAPNHSVRFSLFDGRWGTNVHSVSSYRNKRCWGWSIPHRRFKKHQVFQFCIVFEKEMMIFNGDRNESTILDAQLEKMHTLNKLSGDIKLVLQRDAYSGSSPPRKKRRYNLRSSKEERKLCIKVAGSTLRSASSVFDKMLQSGMKEQQEGEIEIPAKSLTDLEDFVYFINTGKLRSECNPRNLAPIAHVYQMHELFWRCINMAVNKLEIGNFVETVQLFNKYEIEDRFQDVIKFGKDNVSALKSRDDFMKLSHSMRFILGAAQK